jgi:hypothetical protein
MGSFFRGDACELNPFLVYFFVIVCFVFLQASRAGKQRILFEHTYNRATASKIAFLKIQMPNIYLARGKEK